MHWLLVMIGDWQGRG